MTINIDSPSRELRKDADGSPRKRRKLGGFDTSDTTAAATSLPRASQSQDSEDPVQAPGDRSSPIAASSTQADENTAPFLTRNIRYHYTSMNRFEPRRIDLNPNSKYCYRHRPDLKCRRQADELTMDKMQQELHTLSQVDQQSIAHFWSLFSTAPSKHRNLMLQGLLAQCCFPQLSFLAASVRDLIRIDFLSALPTEISFKILSYLDTASLCKAAQVSRRWKYLADDDVVWHRMCEQHIDRKCQKCGWGLPLLDRKRLRDSKLQMQMRVACRGVEKELSSDITEKADDVKTHQKQLSVPSDSPKRSQSPSHWHSRDEDYFKTRFRPWKDVYKDRFMVGINWKHGRATTKIFRGHTNGVMCLQFEDNILATGSYDTTIKIWDTETGQELRTLRGHQSGIRCLQFDDTKLISGSLDKTIKVWNWRTGECISTYTGHQGGVICLHFDSTILVSGSMDNTVKIWNFEDKSTRVLRGHSDWVNSVKVDTASRTVFTASDDLTARLWDLDTGNIIHTYQGHVGQVQQVLPLPREFEFEEHDAECADDGQSTTSGGVSSENESDRHRHHHHRRRSLSSEPQHEQQPTGNPQPSHAMSPPFTDIFKNGRPLPPRYMLTASLDWTLRLWEVTTGRCLRTFFGHVEGVWALGADTLRLVSGAQDQTAKVWDPRTGRCERTFTGHSGPITCIGLSDSRFATGSEDSEVRMYSFRS
ncbi:sulfur metabolite repression control protein [Histoplasma capsulatum G186AR]|uniref:Probable E3 ubiquitin ligase complex SCF subunit sconB n=2 Tax=Ajellomyces capsulatus TaxID=5037 RepID=C0ND61_AJECG|nr:sulfur metabolite repression control protein [Histoplasma capsulatum G186AR]EEH11602.1 sulfur metabolite repression control protein [Histoplasma capsulatum G186AR]KAG5302557.1 sulfur metabolite repression control protein [Histoplasma capsulatum]QSS72043.1 sulfur metabolite repression control protein [Histoplasma capsulatum G186AR]